MRRHFEIAPVAALISTLLLLAPVMAAAQGRNAPPKVAVNGTQVSIDYPAPFEAATVRVSKVGQSEVWSETLGPGSSINGDLGALLQGAVIDGMYQYDIAVTWPDNPEPQTFSGAFRVAGGRIQDASQGPTPAADQFVDGNLRVSGGGCFGCSSGQSISTGKVLAVEVRNRAPDAISAETQYVLAANGAVTSTWRMGNELDSFYISGPSFFMRMAGVTGHVGMGTTNPAGELHVTKDGSSATTNTDLFVERTGTNPSIALLSAQADSVAFGTLSADPFLIATNNQTRIIIGAGGGVAVQGDFSATGTKNFVEDHPTDRTKSIYYAALEGGEAGTFVRGTATLINGNAVINLPEHFGMVTAKRDLTVQLTPRGEWLQAYVVEVTPHKLVLRARGGKSGQIDYLVHGVRKTHADYQVIRSK